MSGTGKRKLNFLLFSSLKMAAATLSSRILGLVREQVMAATFGASGMTDAFSVAYRIPNMLRDLFAEGAFSAAFVPVFSETLLKSNERARQLLRSLFTWLFWVTGSISLLIIFFAPTLVEAVTSDSFSGDPKRWEITVGLVRIMAPFLVLISLAALFMGVLNSLKIFFIPSLAPAFFNLVMILSMLFLPPFLERAGFHPIFSLGVGVIGGGLLQLLVQLPLLIKRRFVPAFKFSSPWKSDRAKVLRRLGLGSVGIAAQQINILVTTLLATGTQVGALSWLVYAFRLFQFPVGILGVSLAGSNLVHFSDLWKRGEKKSAVEVLETSYSLAWLSLIPAFVLLYGLSQESVRLVFERGAFSAGDSWQTHLALRAYLLGLPFYGLYKLFTPLFFALDCPQLPVKISFVSIGLNLIFCLSFVSTYGFTVLALGTSLSMAFNCGLQILFLRKELSLGFSFFFNRRVLKCLLAGGGAWLCLHGVKSFSLSEDPGLWGQSFNYLFWLLTGGAGYIILLIIFGEVQFVKRVLRH